MRLWDTLLLIGGPDSDRALLRDIFRKEYDLLEADSVDHGLFLLEQNRNCIAAVIVDRPPPREPKATFLYLATQRGLVKDIPMLAIITPYGSGELEELAFSLGASDVVPRPYTPAIIRRRVQIMVDLFRSRQRLLTTLTQQAETIRHTNEVMVDALSSIIEYRSAESGSHILRIRRFTEILLKEVARSCPEYKLTPEDISNISSAAALHDIGKISIPDHILNKPGRLTPEEIALMRAHTVNGARMVETLAGVTSEAYLRYAWNICRYHHERWDGGGYPDGLKGEGIPICAQAVGLADAYDALTTDRVYKAAIPPHAAVNMILNGECGVFSTKLLACFKHVVQQFMDLAQEYASGRSPKSDHITLPIPQPVYENREIGTVQISHLKYQTLLHYHAAAVAEMDMDFRTFHIVYNPFPNFRPLPNVFPLERELDAGDMSHIHPDDMEKALREYNFLLGPFFEQGLRRHTFSHRIFSPALGDYRLHRVTILRLDTGDPAQRKAILIWDPITPLPLQPVPPAGDPVRDSKALLLLLNSTVCRKNDAHFTILSGADTLLDLLGYTGAEVQELCGGRFLELIHPEDREDYRRQVAEALHDGIQTEAEYRIQHKDGHILWILERGCVVTDSEGRECFYGTLYNNTSSHIIQSQLETALQRNHLIVDQSDNLIFDWDIVNKRVDLSPNWDEAFGKGTTGAILNSDMLSSSRIHPDDFPAVRALSARALSGLADQETELRIANSANKYLWFRLRMTALLDEDGAPFRAVGTLTNIDSTKRAYLALQEQVQQDPLTGLLNKTSAHAAIRSYLDARQEIGCALLMIDLDNFKQINDRFGHLFGDTVLTRAAQSIRGLFRGGDIIGRVGGDEFMVLMKDISDEQLVGHRCDALLSELENMFLEEHESCHLSCSVGAALAPVHGSSFQELFQRADQALYAAKQKGKRCFSIYRDDLDLSFRRDSTPIDSVEQPELAGDGLVRTVFHRLAHSNDLERTISEVLALVGKRTNVSRVYIFENNDENTHCSNTFEWCNDGIAPEIHNLQNICYETDLPDWEDNYDENGILFCTDIAQLSPGARTLLEPQGIKSLLHCSVRENGVFRGFIGLDECVHHRIWTQEQVDILTFLSEVLASFLLKKRAQDRSENLSANLRALLDRRDEWLYVVDPDTHRLLWPGNPLTRACPEAKAGELCYKAIRSCSAPCEKCPMEALRKGFPLHGGAAAFRSADGLPFTAEASPILWDKKEATLITCRRTED